MGELWLMHSHSWSCAIKVVQGGYQMGIGYSSDRNVVPSPIYSCNVQPGNIYEITSPNIWHYTKCLPSVKYSYSIMLIGPRMRDRKALNNEPLNEQQKEELFDYFLKNI